MACVFAIAQGCAQQHTVDGGGFRRSQANAAGARDSAAASQDGFPSAGGASSSGASQNQSVPTEIARQRIQFTGSRGDVVPGYLWVPAGGGGKKYPGIIVMYGITGNKDDGGVAEASRILASSGFVAMTLDWPGTGERQPPIKKSDRVTNAGVKDWTVADYGAALNWLSARPEVDAQRLGYAGASMGAMTGLVFAQKDPRVRAMVAMVPMPVPLLWGMDDPSLAIAQVAPRPLLCIMASRDSAGPAVCNNAGVNSEKLTLQDGHELSTSRVQAANAARDFFIRHLRN